MGTLILLGGSNCQLNAALEAGRMGHRVVLVDYLANPPAAKACFAHERVSTFDIPACIRTAQHYRADGILTVGTDQPVYTAAKVAEALSLPSSISSETAYIATNKRAMKHAFLRHGVPHVSFALVRRGARPDAFSSLVPPLVLKPLDSQGQRGVFKTESSEESAALLPQSLSFSREEEALAEEFYHSHEVTMSCWLREGQVIPLTLTDRQHLTDPVHIGICAAHRYPSVFAGSLGDITAIADMVAKALGAREGPLYIQLLVGGKGILVNEAACRIGGAFEDIFIPRVTGFDILRAAILTALGRVSEVTIPDCIQAKAENAQVSVQMLFCRPGRLAQVTPVDCLLELPGVISAGYNYREGDRLPETVDATARFGHCVLYSREKNMTELVDMLYGTLRADGPGGEDLLVRRRFSGLEYPRV